MRINGGAVTLLGKVTMPYKRDELEKRIANVPGVAKVDNQITVLPASKSDDELRSGNRSKPSTVIRASTGTPASRIRRCM